MERTLPNGLRVIVTRQTAVPKVTVTLTVLSGYSSDPADETGLANLTADAIQEGTKTKTSREIRRQAFGMGGTLSAAASQDYSSLTVRGLAEFAPQLVDLIADVAMHPTLPANEIAILKQQHLQSAWRSGRGRRSSSPTRRSGTRCSGIIRTRGRAKRKPRSRPSTAQRSRRSIGRTTARTTRFCWSWAR